MILEVADIRIPPGKNDEFDAALKRGLETVVSRAEGYRLHRVVKGIESPERYLLMIWWETLEDHTVEVPRRPALPASGGRSSARSSPSPPSVEHYTVVTEASGSPA